MSLSNPNVARGAVSSLYAAAIVISIFVGGLVPVLIAGAIISAIAYTAIARSTRGAGVEGGRQRNRNRNRDRS
jgi:hypothetical protein